LQAVITVHIARIDTDPVVECGMSLYGWTFSMTTLCGGTTAV
jgi:hypothetical protein